MARVDRGRTECGPYLSGFVEFVTASDPRPRASSGRLALLCMQLMPDFVPPDQLPGQKNYLSSSSTSSMAGIAFSAIWSSPLT